MSVNIQCSIGFRIQWFITYMQHPLLNMTNALPNTHRQSNPSSSHLPPSTRSLFSIIKGHLLLVSLDSGDISRNMLLQPMSEKLLLVFSSRIFMVSCLTLRSLSDLEFIFLYGVRKWSNFILLYIAVQFSQHHLLKRLSFLPCIFLAL